MEPFRAFAADKLPEAQRTQGFAMQSLFIGLGAVVASALPWPALDVDVASLGWSEGTLRDRLLGDGLAVSGGRVRGSVPARSARILTLAR